MKKSFIATLFACLLVCLLGCPNTAGPGGGEMDNNGHVIEEKYRGTWRNPITDSKYQGAKGDYDFVYMILGENTITEGFGKKDDDTIYESHVVSNIYTEENVLYVNLVPGEDITRMKIADFTSNTTLVIHEINAAIFECIFHSYQAGNPDDIYVETQGDYTKIK